VEEQLMQNNFKFHSLSLDNL